MGLSFCVKYGIIKRMDEKFEYTDTDNGIMITGIDRNAGVIEIPDNIDEKPVTGIGRYAFSERLELTDERIRSITARILNMWSCMMGYGSLRTGLSRTVII